MGLIFGGDRQFSKHIRHQPTDAAFTNDEFQPDGFFTAEPENYSKPHRLVSSLNIRIVRAADDTTFADEATTVVMPGQEYIFVPTEAFPSLAWSRVTPIEIAESGSAYGVIESVDDTTLTLADDVDGLDAGDTIHKDGLVATVTDVSGSPDIVIDANPGFTLGEATFYMTRFEDGVIVPKVTLASVPTGLSVGALLTTGTGGLEAEITAIDGSVLTLDQDPGFRAGAAETFEETDVTIDSIAGDVLTLDAAAPAGLAAGDTITQGAVTQTIADVDGADVTVTDGAEFEAGAAVTTQIDTVTINSVSHLTLELDDEVTGLAIGDLILQGTLSAEVAGVTTTTVTLDANPGFEDGGFQFELTREEDIDAIAVVIELEAEITGLATDDILYQNDHSCTVVDVTGSTTVTTNLTSNPGFRAGPVLAYLGGLPTGDAIPAAMFVSIGILE